MITVDDLLQDPARVAELSSETARDILIKLGHLNVLLQSVAFAPTQRFISIKQAASRLNLSTSALYHNKDRFDFIVEIGTDQFRVDYNRMEQWVARQRRGDQ